MLVDKLCASQYQLKSKQGPLLHFAVVINDTRMHCYNYTFWLSHHAVKQYYPVILATVPLYLIICQHWERQCRISRSIYSYSNQPNSSISSINCTSSCSRDIIGLPGSKQVGYFPGCLYWNSLSFIASSFLDHIWNPPPILCTLYSFRRQFLDKFLFEKIIWSITVDGHMEWNIPSSVAFTLISVTPTVKVNFCKGIVWADGDELN